VLFLVKNIQLIIKQEGFIFLFIVIHVFLSCFNLYSFNDFLVEVKNYHHIIYSAYGDFTVRFGKYDLTPYRFSIND